MHCEDSSINKSCTVINLRDFLAAWPMRVSFFPLVPPPQGIPVFIPTTEREWGP